MSVKWICTLNEAWGDLAALLGVFEDHAAAVRAVETQAGEQEWHIKEEPQAPGYYKAILSCFLEHREQSIAIYPVEAGALMCDLTDEKEWVR